MNLFTIIIVAVVIVSILSWLIKNRNNFVLLKEEINEQLSNISNYREQRKNSISDAMNMLGVAHQNDITAIKELTGNNLTSELVALGQKYPDLQNTPSYAMALTKVQQCDAEIASCKNLLNLAIKNYNKAISVFPSNIVALIFGFKRETFVDQDNVEANKTVDTNEVNFDNYKI